MGVGGGAVVVGGASRTGTHPGREGVGGRKGGSFVLVSFNGLLWV